MSSCRILKMALVFQLLLSRQALAQTTFEKSVVLVHVSKQEIDFDSPWQRKNIEVETHLGSYVADLKFLVTAYAVKNAKFIELQKFGESQKFQAEIVFVDYEANLAVLRPKNQIFMQDLMPLVLGNSLPVNTEVMLLENQDNARLRKNLTRLIDVSVQKNVTSDYSSATYNLFSHQTSGKGWSEPIIYQDKLVGITTAQEKNNISALPVPIIQHFLRDQLNENYKGFGAMGIIGYELTSPYLRKMLRADSYSYGIRIAKILNRGAFKDLLQENDVLLSVKGINISDQGYIQHKTWGKIHFSVLISELYAGDILAVTILRAGQILQVAKPLLRFNTNDRPVWGFRESNDEPHLIFAGLVFQELSYDYIRSWGEEWFHSAPSAFLYLSVYKNYPSQRPNERYVILNRVLADEFNQGYQNYEQRIIKSVNGEEVHNLEELGAVLKTKPAAVNGRQYAVFKFKGEGEEVILSYENLAEVHRRVAKKYNVTTESSFFK